MAQPGIRPMRAVRMGWNTLPERRTVERLSSPIKWTARLMMSMVTAKKAVIFRVWTAALLKMEPWWVQQPH